MANPNRVLSLPGEPPQSIILCLLGVTLTVILGVIYSFFEYHLSQITESVFGGL